MRKARRYIIITLLVLNALAILLLWLCCATTWLAPESFPKLTIIGLFFPAFVLFDLVFVLLWLPIRWRWSWIPLAGLLPCLGFVMDYCPISLGGQPPAGCLKIVTWNTAGFGLGEANRDSALQASLDYLKDCDADIICLQEAPRRTITTEDLYRTMEEMNYSSYELHGKLLFSRLPVISHDSIPYFSMSAESDYSTNGSIAYQLLFENDTILLINNHLESNHLQPDEKADYVHDLGAKDMSELSASSRTLLSKISKNTGIRSHQADTIALFIEQHQQMPIICCGDFNDTPISYVYQRINRQLTNAYRQSGTGVGVSYNRKGFWVRIDHIFISGHWKSYHTHVDRSIGVSDHYPLVTWVKKIVD